MTGEWQAPLFGEPIRDFDAAGQPILSRRWECELAKQVRHFRELQRQFRDHLERLMAEAILDAQRADRMATGSLRNEVWSAHRSRT